MADGDDISVLQERYRTGQPLTKDEIDRVEARSSGRDLDNLRHERGVNAARADAAALLMEVRAALNSGRPLGDGEMARYQLRLTLAMATGMLA